MSARLGLYVVLLIALLQPQPLAGAQSLDDMFLHGRQLMRRGDYQLARDFYSETAPMLGIDAAPRALFLQARAELADGDTAAAEATLQALFARYPAADITPRALFLLAQVRRAAGDCTGVLRVIEALVATPHASELGPYPDLQRAMCLGRLGDFRGQLATAQRALQIEDGGPRLTRIEVLEEAGDASLKLGQRREAIDYYNQSLELAGTRAYRAEMLFTTATLARATGQDALATERFRAVVVDYPESARSAGALDALVEMGQHSSVSPLQAGIARLTGREYTLALGLLDQVAPDSTDWGAARYAHATALIRQGEEVAARQVLRGLADADAGQAGRALLQLGQSYERSGEFELAQSTYVNMASRLPDHAPEAWYRAGFVRYVRGDRGGALAAFDAGLASGQPMTPVVQAQLQYWVGRLLAPGSSAAQSAFAQAAAAAPESYHGLRAFEALRGPSLAAASLHTTSEEESERRAWLSTQDTTPEQVTADLAALPGLRRADTLLDLGMRTEVSWEVDAVMRRFVQTRDVAHLSALAEWLLVRDLPHLALLVGRQTRDLAGLAALPTAVQKQVYPAGWGDLVAEHAAREGLDPLLMLALMRQESSFDPRARSGAQAMGLMQIVPSTARDIAAHLGRSEFELEDLYRPDENLEFGAWYLRSVLREFDGRPFPALAAYNAGGGNVSRWLTRFGDDPDVLVELVPFTETRLYLRAVYENYAQYRRLYASDR